MISDNEIIKALECCCKDNYAGDCPNCPLQLNGNCNIILAEHALDLINRQKAEIDRLNAKIKELYKEIEQVALMTVETTEQKRRDG